MLQSHLNDRIEAVVSWLGAATVLAVALVDVYLEHGNPLTITAAIETAACGGWLAHHGARLWRKG
ncbi:MAG TPA: hypothetical protein V6D47_14235 [Oscillatoriaceae cyanobacterium]